MAIPDFKSVMLPLLHLAKGRRANKGIFITTPSFTRDAQNYVAKINSKIVLIDGEQLSQLMIDHNVGVTPVTSYETKKIDSDYFIGPFHPFLRFSAIRRGTTAPFLSRCSGGTTECV